MALTTSQFEILRQLFSTADQTQKTNFLTWVNSAVPGVADISVTTVEDFLSSRKEVNVCPHCGGNALVKNGHWHGHQRYVCKDCKKTVGLSKDTILFSTKKEMSVWTTFVNCMVQRFALRKCAAICSINLSTAFAWRHKILDALSKMMEAVKLKGVVECDETYQLISYKGNHKNSKTFVMPRPANHRAGKASQRGLSKEQVCVTTGVDLSGQSIGKISNLGKPTHHDLSSVLGGRIAAGSTFVTDSHRGYSFLAGNMDLDHIRIPSNKHVFRGHNIQKANNFHQGLKYLINGLFKGVATKYLNNYVVYHAFVGFAHGTEEKKESGMLSAFAAACQSLWKKNQSRPAVPVHVPPSVWKAIFAVP